MCLLSMSMRALCATATRGSGESHWADVGEVSQLRRFVADADVFSRQADGTTIAQQYVREGIEGGLR